MSFVHTPPAVLALHEASCALTHMLSQPEPEWVSTPSVFGMMETLGKVVTATAGQVSQARQYVEVTLDGTAARTRQDAEDAATHAAKLLQAASNEMARCTTALGRQVRPVLLGSLRESPHMEERRIALYGHVLALWLLGETKETTTRVRDLSGEEIDRLKDALEGLATVLRQEQEERSQ